MKFILVILLPLLGLAHAAPTSSLVSSHRILPRQASNATAAATTQLTFTGAGASFTITAPVDGSAFQIPSPISVDHIAQAGAATCTVKGVDNAQLGIIGANTGATFAPPQTVVSGSCQ